MWKCRCNHRRQEDCDGTKRVAELESELNDLRASFIVVESLALRKDFVFLQSLFERKWNGVVGSGCSYQWSLVGNYRHTVQKMVGDSFHDACVAAMGEQP
jgi:hypothetical protein